MLVFFHSCIVQLIIHRFLEDKNNIFQKYFNMALYKIMQLFLLIPF